ncbi:MAG: hypothetical protein ACKO4S_00180 [Snowella sp.]
MTTIKYPTHRLDWVNEPPSILKTAVSNYLNEIATDDDLLIIRDYIKHWIELESHQFENESDREILLRELAQSKTSSDIDKLTDNLLNFGIDPF